MAVLIVGGTGFIGARLTKHMVETGKDVVCYDLYPNLKPVLKLGSKVKVITGDISHIEDIINTIREFRVETIVNLAYMLGRESENDLQRGIRINVLGMNNIFEAARLMGINRVVYASSISVYGPQHLFGEKPVTEEDFCRPTNAYGAHKVLNEFMAAKYMEHHDMSIPGLRIPIVSGPGRKSGNSVWASTYVDLPLVGKPVSIPYRSTQKALITFVDDVAKVLGWLCLADSLNYAIYNLYAHSVSLGTLAEKVRKFLPNAEIRFDETAEELHTITYVSSERIEKEINYRLPSVEKMIETHIEEARRLI